MSSKLKAPFLIFCASPLLASPEEQTTVLEAPYTAAQVVQLLECLLVLTTYRTAPAENHLSFCPPLTHWTIKPCTLGY